jgi:ABC-type transport system substrate-binding protein
VLFEKLASPGEPFDIGWIGWLSDPDPALLNSLFDGTTIGAAGFENYSYFNSPRYNRLLERAATLSGSARYRAYGSLDIDLAQNAAPAVSYAYDNALTFVGARTGCVVLQPELDLAAACLK